MNIKYILFFVSLIALFSSCSKDTDPALPTYPETVLTHPENGTFYELKESLASNEVFSLSFTAELQDQLAVGPVRYILQVDSVGRNFANAQVVTSISADMEAVGKKEYTIPVTYAQLNNILVNNLMLQALESASVEFRIVTNIGESNTLAIPSSASNIFQADVMPYPLSRESLFMVGNMFGSPEWDINSYRFVMFRATPGAAEDTYTARFNAGSEFKLVPQASLGNWDGAYGSGGIGVLSLNVGNIGGFDTDTYYTVTVNLSQSSYSIEPYDASTATEYTTIGLIGGFNDWSADLALTQFENNPHIWYIDNCDLGEGDVKFRANADWAVSWGGSTFPYGGGTGDNIPVKSGRYYIVFNDLTGQYVFYKK